jgi:hypothetical protein
VPGVSETNQALGFCIIELFGHRRLGGYVSEMMFSGESFMRIDMILADGSALTQFYSPKAVYGMTPTTEEIAKAIGANVQAPIERWELKALETARTSMQNGPYDVSDDPPVGPPF